MEIKDFISETILQICQGMEDAKEKLAKYDAIVNPKVTCGNESSYWIPKKHEHVALERRVQNVEMDIAVEVSENCEEGGVAKLTIPSILSIGGDGKSGIEQRTINRVHFTIPVCLPTQE